MSGSGWRWPGGRGWIDIDRAHPPGLRLRPVLAASDAALLQRWFSSERGRFWAMPDKSCRGVRMHYTRMQRSPDARAFLGHADGRAAFVIECYDPACHDLAAHYRVEPGDLGLHLFVAAPVTRVPNFTRDVFRFVLGFMFGRLAARRVVVEPDVDNLRIHALNRSMGFRDAGCIALPDKIAILAFCTRADFMTCQPTEPAT
ncbi:GNAT family N-acetyltransferase [Herbaspirillum sp. YR522]|uniref:GNAT family N-acetyltransferase n=1 Tax=Herbaspirillum sp. YR522 TaxID=1144342 RepID=UPI00026F5CE6|nr:GNAT family N-acetyltransferase [Herbaspirillum sp. YR522]EJM98647.1 acetyltransferase, ribosomal protein N-acetylase [Herbaspirillum sp. YR522]